jgi:hypothetical protein
MAATGFRLGASESETFTQSLRCACIKDLPIPTGDTSVIGSRISLLSILNSRKDPASAHASLLLHVGKPSFLQFLWIVLKTQLAASKNRILNLPNR